MRTCSLSMNLPCQPHCGHLHVYKLCSGFFSGLMLGCQRYKKEVYKCMEGRLLGMWVRRVSTEPTEVRSIASNLWFLGYLVPEAEPTI